MQNIHNSSEIGTSVVLLAQANAGAFKITGFHYPLPFHWLGKPTAHMELSLCTSDCFRSQGDINE